MSAAARSTSKRRGRPGSPRTAAALGALLAVYLTVPVLLFLYRALTVGGLSASQDGLVSATVTSLVSATISTALIVALGVPLARALARATGLLARAVGVLVQLPLALPPVMSGIVLIYVVGPYTWLGSRLPLTGTLAGVVIAQTFVAAPFLIISARSAFEGLAPEADDLAATLGLGPAARFWRVDLPLARSGIVAGTLLTWLRALGEFGATSLIAYYPATLPVYTSVQFAGSGLEGTSAPTLIALVLAGAVLLAVNLPQSHRGRRTALPEPAAPPALAPMLLAFDIDLTAGDFRPRAAHQSAGRRLAVLGPSGAGKSLLLKAIAGLLPGQTVLIGDDDVSALAPEQRHLGYVPQSRLLMEHRSVWRNATFSPLSDPARAAWWLRELGIEGLADREPAGLSGGERQRASLVQALASDPRVLLLDEPFSALDTPTRRGLVERLRGLQRSNGLSTVLVTHDPREARMLADEIVLLEDGRILQAGPVHELLARPATLRAGELLGVENLVEIECAEAGVLSLAGAALPVPGAQVGERWLARIPREALRALSGQGAMGGDRAVAAARVLDAIDAGSAWETVLDVDGHRLVCASAAEPEAGATVSIAIETARVAAWPAGPRA